MRVLQLSHVFSSPLTLQCKALAKRTLHVEDGILLHFSSSMLSGVFVALAMNPFDVLTTRLEAKKGAEDTVPRALGLVSPLT